MHFWRSVSFQDTFQFSHLKQDSETICWSQQTEKTIPKQNERKAFVYSHGMLQSINVSHRHGNKGNHCKDNTGVLFHKLYRVYKFV